MNKPKSYILKAETGHFKTTGQDANLIVTRTELNNLIDTIDSTALAKTGAKLFIATEVIDCGIKLTDLAQKAKDLLFGTDIHAYEIIVKIISRIND